MKLVNKVKDYKIKSVIGGASHNKYPKTKSDAEIKKNYNRYIKKAKKNGGKGCISVKYKRAIEDKFDDGQLCLAAGLWLPASFPQFHEQREDNALKVVHPTWRPGIRPKKSRPPR